MAMFSPIVDRPLFDHPFFTQLGPLGFCHKEDKLHPVVDQRDCNSCTSQSVTLVVAAAVAINHEKKFVKLSAQCCVDCGPHNDDATKKPDKRGCKTAKFKDVFTFATKDGFYADGLYRYTAEKGKCVEKEGRRLRIGGVKRPEPSKILDHIRQQPLTARIKITPKFIVHSGEGVYDPELKEGEPIPVLDKEVPENTFHAVAVIGFGVTADGIEYYIIQNSYGTKWGFKGYAKVLRSCLDCFRYPVPPYIWS